MPPDAPHPEALGDDQGPTAGASSHRAGNLAPAHGIQSVIRKDLDSGKFSIPAFRGLDEIEVAPERPILTPFLQSRHQARFSRTHLLPDRNLPMTVQMMEYAKIWAELGAMIENDHRRQQVLEHVFVVYQNIWYEALRLGYDSGAPEQRRPRGPRKITQSLQAQEIKPSLDPGLPPGAQVRQPREKAPSLRPVLTSRNHKHGIQWAVTAGELEELGVSEDRVKLRAKTGHLEDGNEILQETWQELGRDIVEQDWFRKQPVTPLNPFGRDLLVYSLYAVQLSQKNLSDLKELYNGFSKPNQKKNTQRRIDNEQESRDLFMALALEIKMPGEFARGSGPIEEHGMEQAMDSASDEVNGTDEPSREGNDDGHEMLTQRSVQSTSVGAGGDLTARALDLPQTSDPTDLISTKHGREDEEGDEPIKDSLPAKKRRLENHDELSSDQREVNAGQIVACGTDNGAPQKNSEPNMIDPIDDSVELVPLAEREATDNSGIPPASDVDHDSTDRTDQSGSQDMLNGNSDVDIQMSLTEVAQKSNCQNEGMESMTSMFAKEPALAGAETTFAVKDSTKFVEEPAVSVEDPKVSVRQPTLSAEELTRSPSTEQVAGPGQSFEEDGNIASAQDDPGMNHHLEINRTTGCNNASDSAAPGQNHKSGIRLVLKYSGHAGQKNEGIARHGKREDKHKNGSKGKRINDSRPKRTTRSMINSGSSRLPKQKSVKMSTFYDGDDGDDDYQPSN